MIIYKGPSMLDGAPIVAIATGLQKRSTNRKTGSMAQLWILADGAHPMDALRSGADHAVCGDCSLRGELGKGRACYVNLGFAPSQIYKAYQAGKYETCAPNMIAMAFVGHKVRLGAYGDPAALPLAILLAVTRYCDGWTGYTHQWRTCPTAYSHFLMASVESEREATAARAIFGYRTFRVKQAGESTLHGEVVCPASAEMGHKTTCEKCLACMGKAAKAKAPIVINAHGIGVASFAKRKETV